MDHLNKVPIQLIIVQSQMGAKGDFLAGWLGTLPNFIENYWTVDCETGQSFTKANFFKFFNSNNNLDNFLSDIKFVLSAHQHYFLSATTHHNNVSTFITEQQHKNVDIISIKITEHSKLDVAWNGFVKTNLTKHRYDYSIWENVTYGVDYCFDNKNNITDVDRQNYIESNFNDLSPYIAQVDPAAKHVFIYDEIFVPGGSQLLAEKLKLKCSLQHHKLWDKNLEFSYAPDIIDRFGKIYSIDDFKRRFQKQTQ